MSLLEVFVLGVCCWAQAKVRAGGQLLRPPPPNPTPAICRTALILMHLCFAMPRFLYRTLRSREHVQRKGCGGEAPVGAWRVGATFAQGSGSGADAVVCIHLRCRPTRIHTGSRLPAALCLSTRRLRLPRRQRTRNAKVGRNARQVPPPWTPVPPHATPTPRLLIDGFRSLWMGNPNMNSLVGVGSTASFLVGAASFLVPSLGLDTGFLEEPVMLLAFVLLGESRGVGQVLLSKPCTEVGSFASLYSGRREACPWGKPSPRRTCDRLFVQRWVPFSVWCGLVHYETFGNFVYAKQGSLDGSDTQHISETCPECTHHQTLILALCRPFTNASASSPSLSSPLPPWDPSPPSDHPLYSPSQPAAYHAPPPPQPPGRALESRAKVQAASDLKALAHLIPATARLQLDPGAAPGAANASNGAAVDYIQVATRSVRAGDIIRVLPGEPGGSVWQQRGGEGMGRGACHDVLSGGVPACFGPCALGSVDGI